MLSFGYLELIFQTIRRHPELPVGNRSLWPIPQDAYVFQERCQAVWTVQNATCISLYVTFIIVWTDCNENSRIPFYVFGR